jgi:3-deoxy-D-manno-octulosonic acid kinase
VYLVEGGSGLWAVRHYRRGGLLAPVTGDRYLRGWSLPRPFAEARASELCRERGIPTPPVMAAAVYGRGPVYRGDLITRYLPDSLTLGAYLEGRRGSGGEGVEALALAGDLARLLAKKGVHHPDLNVGNILLEAASHPPVGHVLDLDRVRVVESGRPLSPDRMLRRLARSLRKWQEGRGDRLPEEAWKALEEGGRG